MPDFNKIKPKNLPAIPNNFLLQSPYLYLQAAGSDGTDQSAPGVHLRWSPMRSLVKNHLFKGDLAAGAPYKTSIGFNRPDDYVYVYRAPYKQKFYLTLDFQVHKPYLLVESGTTRRWDFNVDGLNKSVTQIVVWFSDVAQYDSLRATVADPKVDPLALLMKYKGVVEIVPVHKLFFCCDLILKGPLNPQVSTGCVMIESISVSDELPDAKKVLSSRRKVCKNFSQQSSSAGDTRRSAAATAGQSPEDAGPIGMLQAPANNLLASVCCENIQFVRFSYQNCFPLGIRFETYHDFFMSWNDWQFQGKFSLSAHDSEVEKRLMHPAQNVISLWQKFNGGAAVNLKNYQDKWSRKQGLKDAVLSYLDLSRSDPKAVAEYASEAPNDSSKMKISYLDMLNLVALDYHAARMLGLGHVDSFDKAEPGEYIYLALYETLVDFNTLKPGPQFQKYHISMSIPTGLKNYRLPPPPFLYPLTYGMGMDDASADTVFITDANGYAPYADIRVVNLEKRPYPYDKPMGPFWEDSTEFCMCDYTRPVMYGIEHRKQGSPAWQMPELSHDTEYLDPAGIPEAVPVPDHVNPLFVHFEKEAGKHEYALYGVNWFSRTSPVGNIRTTDETVFPKRNTLLPPFNFGVQYIQKENPLIFTSQTEQDALQAKEAASPGADNSPTRITFDWNHVNHDAYQDAGFAELFFRIQQPKAVMGEVKSAVELPGHTVEIKTKSYQIVSTNPVQTIMPSVAAGEEGKYVGSLLVTPNGQFLATAVKQPAVAGEGATFTLKMVDNPVSMDPNNSGEFITVHKWSHPEAGEKFMVVENLASDVQWKKLAKKVPLVKHSTHTETVTESDGTQRTYKYGGVYAPATITDLTEGMYKIQFSNYVLAGHPDPAVGWYKGTARLLTIAGKVKVLEVWSIEYKGANPLVIHVYDPAYTNDPVQTAGPVNVNFHPGYRLYLQPEPAATFDSAHILPGAGAGSKTTYMAIRAVDDIPAAPDIYSALSVPVPLLAREIVKPKIPGIPVGPTFATRPDFYGKSTYTFDVVVDTSNGRKPFSLLFFRAADRALIDALYKKGTGDVVAKDLAARKEDGYFSQRWLDAVQFNFAPDGSFKEHNGYKLPNPDNTKTNGSFTGSNKPGAMAAAVKNAVWKAFTPLTKQPVVYDYINTGYQTANNKPLTKDITTGNLLKPSDPKFDHAPMVRKFVENNTTRVRFTDYTLDGASNNVYFYYAIEMSVTSERSGPSPIAGPISLVNAYPAEQPSISKVRTQTANPLLNVSPAVVLEMGAYLESEGIAKIELYRATSPALAQSVRTMTKVGAFGVAETVKDTFTDLPFPPFGETLYYRASALRKIRNEKNEEEYIPSKPSNTVLASVIDVVSPQPPQLQCKIGSETSSPRTFHNVELKWNKTVHNGTYHLYKLNKLGNWERIHSASTNDQEITYAYPAALPKEDADGNELFYRFRVEVLNASGLSNSVQNELTV